MTDIKNILSTLSIHKSDTNTMPVDGIVYETTQMYNHTLINDFMYTFPLDRSPDIISNIQGINCTVKVEINYDFLFDVNDLDIVVLCAPCSYIKLVCLFDSNQPLPEHFGVKYDSYFLQAHVRKNIEKMEIFSNNFRYKNGIVSCKTI